MEGVGFLWGAKNGLAFASEIIKRKDRPESSLVSLDVLVIALEWLHLSVYFGLLSSPSSCFFGWGGAKPAMASRRR